MALGIDDESLYGAAVVDHLRVAQHAVEGASQIFVRHFYEVLAGTAEGSKILGRLQPAEFAHLQERQVEHLTMLFDPELTLQRHTSAAQMAGRAHALVGVDLPMLIESYALYQQELQDELLPLIDASHKEALIRLVGRRVLMDLQAQAISYRRIDTEVALAISQIDQLVQTTGNFSDLIRGAMAVIGNLEGEVSALFARVDASGELQIEASQGVAGHRYHQAMMSGELPKVSIDPTRPAGQGPGGRAWRSGEVVISDAWVMESRNKPWQKMGEELGFRSSAAVPLPSDSGETIAMLSLYSVWPGFFSTLRISNFLNHVQKSLSHAVERLNAAPVVALPLRQAYRKWMAEERMVMLYQPIIDLGTGKLTKVEALARLVDGEGRMVAPDRFLPACGSEELFGLLQYGLRQAEKDCRMWTEAGVETAIALNFPAEGIGDPRYERVIFESVERSCLGGGHLTLEILESHEGSNHVERRQAFLQKLRDAHVCIAEDDLGSGHSSLLRLDQYAFDEVKMDQALVRGAVKRPQRALEFMLYLTRLAHAFGMRLTVEGLEHRALIEAAMILGADQGQGYGIARPMPASEIPGWARQFRYDIDPRLPETALGAMATYMLWDLQAGAHFNDDEGGAVDRRRTVEAFISDRGLERSELWHLLEQHFATGAKARARVRANIIEGFTQVWLDEVTLAAEG